MAHESHRHWRVVPEQARTACAAEERLDEAPLLEGNIALVKPIRKHRHRDRHSWRALVQLHVRADARSENRLLDEHDAIVLRGASHEVLRTLPDEVPPQMREANQR